MMRKYQAIGPLLTKVEGLVVNTNTGQSRKLQQYYAHWETKIFKALTAVCLHCGVHLYLFNWFSTYQASNKIARIASRRLKRVYIATSIVISFFLIWHFISKAIL